MFNAKQTVLTDVYLYYTHLANPRLRKDEVENPRLPRAGKSFETGVLVTAEDFTAMKKHFKGAWNGFPVIKEVYSAEDFEKKYQAPPPYEADTYYMWSLRLKADFQDGTSNNKQVSIKLGEDVDKEDFDPKSIGNGTKAHVQFKHRIYKNGKGSAVDLIAVKILEFVKFESSVEEVEVAFDGEDVDYEVVATVSEGAGEDNTDYDPMAGDSLDEGAGSTGDDEPIPF